MPERGSFFGLQVIIYERVGISLAEVHSKVGKCVILVCTFYDLEVLGLQMDFMTVKKSIEICSFVIYSYFKGSA